MPLSLTTNPINYSTERRFLAEQSRTLVDQKAENLKTLQNSKGRIICKALSDEQFREHLFSSDILKRLKLPNTDESRLIIKGIQTDIDHHLALKLAAEELGVESTQSHYGDIIKAQQSKLEIYDFCHR